MRKVRYKKPPLSVADQIALLQKRDLQISDSAKAEFYLLHLNYYRFKGYSLPFQIDQVTHRYSPGTSFDDVLNLYFFDRKLRVLVLDAIERVEISLRTQLAYHLSRNHRTPHPHLRRELFYDSEMYHASMERLHSAVRRNHEDSIKHFESKYQEGLPPIWAVVELMSMGQLSKWFSNIASRKDRQAISSEYGLHEKIMVSCFAHLSLVRNHAAHQDRLWNREFMKMPMLPNKGNQDLRDSILPKQKSDRRYRKIYNTLTLLAYLLLKIEGDTYWKSQLFTVIEQHEIDEFAMGIPENWKDLPVWR